MIDIAKKRFPEPQQFAAQLGRMAEAAHGSPGAATMFQAYRDAVKEAAAKRAWVHGKLAEAGAVHVLCEEILVETIPWDAAASPDRIQTWRNEVLNAHAPVLDGLCRRVADGMQKQGKFAGFLPLAEHLLPKHLQKQPSLGPGGAALFAAVVAGLPLQPPANPWRKAFQNTPEGLPATIASRLRVFQFMLGNEAKSQTGEWLPASFPRSEATWSRDVRELPPNDKADVLAWCMKGFAHCGATTPKDAIGLIRLLDAAGVNSAQSVAEAIRQLLQDRDKVTWVLSLAALVDAALTGSEPKVRWGDILGAILGRSDATVRQLFLAYLKNRFWPPSPDRDKKIQHLYEDAGLLEPKLSPVRNHAALPTSPPASGGLMATLRNLLHSVLGRPEEPPPSPPPKKKGGDKK